MSSSDSQPNTSPVRATGLPTTPDPASIRRVFDATEQVFGPGTFRQTKTTGEVLEGTWELRDGQVVVTRVCITSDTGIGRDALQQVARGVHRYADQLAAATVARVWDMDADPLQRSLANARRRRSWTEDELRQAADVYRAAVADGVPPRQAVADHYTVSLPMASKVIRMARDQGLLEEKGEQ